MEKEAQARKPNKNDRWDSSKPGTIVAGPEAHAREGAGKTPSGEGVKGKEPPKKPADRSGSDSGKSA